jgi:hypothetical protein
MKNFIRLMAGVCVGLFGLVQIACAQNNFVTPGGSNADGRVDMCLNGSSQAVPCSVTNPLPVNASVSASITGFPTTQSTGTPISVTTGGVTGTLPAGTVVVASNTGATNNAYCKLGASATTSDQLIPPNSWFAFTVGAATQLTCITSTSTTTVNMVGGSGLPTGSGGGGGGGSSSNASVSATGSAVPASATYIGITSGGNLTGWTGAVTNAGTFAVQATQSGTWTVQPGNTPNTTPWLVNAPDLTQTFSITSSTTSTALALVGSTSVQFNLTGSFVASVIGQISNDNSNWVSVPLLNLGSAPPAYIAAATGATTTGNYLLVGSQGARFSRVNVTYTSGTVAGAITATSQGQSVSFGDYVNYLQIISATPALNATAWNTNTYTTGQTNSINADLHGALWGDLGAVNGVALLAGAGATGTGSPRTTQAQDTSTIAGSAPGTAGSASANVLTVQGVTSMTPVQVSQATAASLNATVVGTGTFATQVNGFTSWAGSTLGAAANYGTSPGAVLVPSVNAFITNTPAVTATGATSNASSGVATSSTNLPSVAYNYGFNGTTWDQLQVDSLKNLKVAQNASDPVTATLQNAAVASGNGTVLTVNGMSSAILTVNCASCSGGTTINFEGSEDTTNFTAITSVNIGTSTLATTTTASGITVWQMPVAGFQQIRARISAYSAGTVTITGHTVPVTYDPKTVNANIVSNTATNQSVNLAQVAGGTVNTGNGTASGSQRIAIASDNTAFSVNAQPTPVTSGGLSVFFLQPTASDNHAVIKAGAGQVYKISITNNSATVNYVRLYNATTGFNGCNSATNLVYANAIPASTSVGGLADQWDQGMAFSTGISICVTSGYATTDTTNATATAMNVNIGWK